MRLSAAACVVLLIVPTSAQAAPVEIPNHSFELPAVERDNANPFGALPFIEEWDETEIGLADELNQDTGVFLNTCFGEPDHIINPDRDRLAFVSTLIGNAVRQELAAVYEIGASYEFTIAVGTSFTFPAGDPEALEVALYYFDAGVEQVIASTIVTGAEVDTAVLIDVSVSIPPVEADAVWAGAPIGLLVRPDPTDPDDTLDEGFWNIDNARLERSDSNRTADLDGDGDVDLLDISKILIQFSGPN